jgi:AcrR family transcriptional regulator
VEDEGTKQKEYILDCALSAFLKNGYKNTSLQAIAEEAGLPMDSVLRYYNFKSDIFEDLAIPVTERTNYILTQIKR